MRKVTLKRIRKALGILLSVICFVSVPMMEVNAAEANLALDDTVEIMECTITELPEGYPKTRNALSDCIISVGFSSEGMDIDILTSTSLDSVVIGVKDIRVEQKMWYGWKLVAVSSGAEYTNTSGVTVHVIFRGAIKDKTYHVTCVHYADVTDDGVDNIVELPADTGEFVFTY